MEILRHNVYVSNSSKELLKKEWLSVSEVAKTLGLSNQTVIRYCEDGILKAVRIGKKTIRIDAESLELFIKPFTQASS